jgi:hypothetical protein
MGSTVPGELGLSPPCRELLGSLPGMPPENETTPSCRFALHAGRAQGPNVETRMGSDTEGVASEREEERALTAEEVHRRGVRARNRALSQLARKYPDAYRFMRIRSGGKRPSNRRSA